jgi:glycosyltransferase involved in cell wall biosynthesis
VGRVAVEKNLEAFLSLDVRGRKVIVGDGPARAALEARFPDAEWLGYRHGDALVEQYADADVFVFPSRTDTFGLVMLEANACGTPVAAYPVTGPVDVVVDGVNGALDADLATAIERALAVDRAGCRAFAERHGWDAIADRLLDAQVPVVEAAPAAATP